MSEPNELDAQFEEAWASSAELKEATRKELCRYWWLKGRICGIDTALALKIGEPSPSGLKHFAVDRESRPSAI